MKIKFSYYSLRFSAPIAWFCHRLSEEFNAEYIDLPFLLPTESGLCEYKASKIITFENRAYYVADENADIHFKSIEYSQGLYFGVINITRSVPEYVLWATFYDEEIGRMLKESNVASHLRVYANPNRFSATLKCNCDAL